MIPCMKNHLFQFFPSHTSPSLFSGQLTVSSQVYKHTLLTNPRPVTMVSHSQPMCSSLTLKNYGNPRVTERCQFPRVPRNSKIRNLSEIKHRNLCHQQLKFLSILRNLHSTCHLNIHPYSYGLSAPKDVLRGWAPSHEF